MSRLTIITFLVLTFLPTLVSAQLITQGVTTATTTIPGTVKPDGTSLTVSGSGTISAIYPLPAPSVAGYFPYVNSSATGYTTSNALVYNGTTLSVNAPFIMNAGGIIGQNVTLNTPLPTAATTYTSPNAPIEWDAFGASSIEAAVGIGAFNGTWHGTYLNSVGLMFYGSNGWVDETLVTGGSNALERFETRGAEEATGGPEFQIFSTGGNNSPLSVGSSAISAQVPFIAKSASTVPLTIKESSGQTADSLDINNSSSTILAKISSTGVVTTPSVSQAVRAVTSGTADSASATDHLITFNSSGSVAETLPAASTWTGQEIVLANLSSTHSVTVTNSIVGSIADTLATLGAVETFTSDGTNIWLAH